MTAETAVATPRKARRVAPAVPDHTRTEMGSPKPEVPTTASEETPSNRLERLRRAACADTPNPDIAFLTTVVAELGALVTRAVATVDQVAATLAGRGSPELPPVLTELARAIDVQAGRYGIWHRSAARLPTELPNTCIPVLFCTRRAPYPKQGFYVTDAAGTGSWEIYSALQDHALDYRGPAPEIWALAPDRPDPSIWDTLDNADDAPLTWTQDRAVAALRADLAALEIPDPERLVALPSLQRLWRESEQVRAAYLRTATALGVPATAHGPAKAARALAAQRIPSPQNTPDAA